MGATIKQIFSIKFLGDGNVDAYHLKHYNFGCVYFHGQYDVYATTTKRRLRTSDVVHTYR